jgi:DNA polymerase IV
VQRRRRRRSIGAQRALGRKERSIDEIEAILLGLIDRVTRRLRTAHRRCRTVVLRFRFDDFSRATRSHTFLVPSSRTGTIATEALTLLRAAHPVIERRGLTLIGVALTNLTDEREVQLTLPFDHARELDEALDRVRERFGSAAIMRGALVGRGPDITVPLLPDEEDGR